MEFDTPAKKIGLVVGTFVGVPLVIWGGFTYFGEPVDQPQEPEPTTLDEGDDKGFWGFLPDIDLPDLSNAFGGGQENNSENTNNSTQTETAPDPTAIPEQNQQVIQTGNIPAGCTKVTGNDSGITVYRKTHGPDAAMDFYTKSMYMYQDGQEYGPYSPVSFDPNQPQYEATLRSDLNQVICKTGIKPGTQKFARYEQSKVKDTSRRIADKSAHINRRDYR